MSKKKVLILFTSSELGGAEKSLTRLAFNIKDKIDVQLATMDGKGPWVDFCKVNNFNPIILGNRRNINKHGSINFKNIFKLIILIYQKEYDIIYGVGIRLSALIRFIIFFSKKTKYINAIRWNPASIQLSDKVFRLLERYFSSFVDFYICNSNASKHLLIQNCNINKEKIKVIYNGIETKNINSNIENKIPHLLITANNSPRKGIAEFLINVIKPIHKKGKIFHLFIAGRDDMNGKIKKIVKENNLENVVTLLGFVHNIDKYFRNSDIFILPSLEREGCPTSILEAMSFAKPTIAFNIDGIPELIKNEKNGFLIERHNYIDFQKALSSLLENKILRERMGKGALLRQKNYFNIYNFTSQHVECFESLTS